MGCVFSNVRLGHEVAVPRLVAARAIAALAAAAAAGARDRWERELAAWLAGYARAVMDGHAGFDVGDLAWTPDHFLAQQAFVLAMLDDAADREGSEVRLVLERMAALIGGHDRSWVVVGRRWGSADSDVITGN
jgi:hypothetical protein